MSETYPWSDKLLFVDLETSGLDVHGSPRDTILEVGAVVTDLSFKTLSTFNMVRHLDVLESGQYAGVVLDMHFDNGLFRECLKGGDSLRYIDSEFRAWLLDCLMGSMTMAEVIGNPIGNPKGVPIEDRPRLVGSGVHFDKAFIEFELPSTFNLLSYRVLDLSSIKEWFQLFTPERLDGEPEDRKLHRSLPDIEDAIARLKFYTVALRTRTVDTLG